MPRFADLARLLIPFALASAAPSQISVPSPSQAGIDYAIAFVRQPRRGDLENTIWPEVFRPTQAEPGSDLVLLHPDGTETVLVDCDVDPTTGIGDAITDPAVSFCGRYLYYVRLYDARRDLEPWESSPGGSDIFRYDLVAGTSEQLTFVRPPSGTPGDVGRGEFEPNTAAGTWRKDAQGAFQPARAANWRDESVLSGGVFNTGPSPLPGGRIAFTSSRRGFDPPRSFTKPTLQLHVMDWDGSNVRCVGPMSNSGALHPIALRDGRMMFSSHEDQSLRDQRSWALWYIAPDGRDWGPLISSFQEGAAFHFATQMSNGDIVALQYYNLNNNGFGALVRLPQAGIDPALPGARFGPAPLALNPPLGQTTVGGFAVPYQMPFTPLGLYALTPFTHANDYAAPVAPGGTERVGKVTHPSAAPGNELLLVWSPGPVNAVNRPVTTPHVDGGLYLWRPSGPGDVIDGPGDLVRLLDDPNFNEAWPRAIVPYAAIHGVEEPTELPFLPNDGTAHPELPAGTAFGLVGASSVYKRESFPASDDLSAPTFFGLEPMNSLINTGSLNWRIQGADAGHYDDQDIWALRIVGLEPNTDRGHGAHYGRRFFSHPRERMRVLGEIPLRKTNGQGAPVLDPEGNPDTSFLAKIAADTPFTFQTIDRDGLVLHMSQTWHQVRPGEVRTDCGGCHSHSQSALEFAATAAARPNYPIRDLTRETPLVVPRQGGDPGERVVASGAFDVEFYRDIRPILQNHCVQCHSGPEAQAPARLVFDQRQQLASPEEGVTVPADYARLALDHEARWGIPSVIRAGGQPLWRGAQVSRYVRVMQARRSLLAWKVYGRRLDGWTNGDFPTETVRGDPSTLPPGVLASMADIDFDGVACPPPGSSVPPLSAEQKLAIGRWIDLGCPVNHADPAGYGWHLDAVRPALTVQSPRAGTNAPPPTLLRIGMADGNSGIDRSTFRVVADIEINGIAAGTDLAPRMQEVADGVFELPLQPLPTTPRATLFVEVADRRGNLHRVDHRFSVVATARLGMANTPTSSLVIDGVGRESIRGPFVVEVDPGATMEFALRGAPHADGWLVIAPLNAGHLALPGFGTLDIGVPPAYPSLSWLRHPFDPVRLDGNGHGTFAVTFPPWFPPGRVAAVQAALFDPAASFETALRFSAAIEVFAGR